MGNRYAIVCHGYPCLQTGFFPVLHFSFIQHAAAAVDHHGIRGKVLWEFGAGAELEIQGLAGLASGITEAVKEAK